MNAKENIRIAIYSIRTNMMRSLLTMLGIIIGVSSVIAIITVGDGGRDYLVTMVKDLGQSVVSIMVDTVKADASQYITRDDVERIKGLEHVKYVSPYIMGMGSGRTRHTQGFIFALAGNTDFRHVSGLEIKQGHFFTQDEYNSAAQVCVILSMSAQSMFGSSNAVGQFIEYTPADSDQTVQLRVIGIAEMSMMGDSADMMDSFGSMGGMGGMADSMGVIIMPSTLTDQLAGSSGAYDNIYITADDEANLDIVGNAAENMLYIQHGNAGSGVYTTTNMATYIDLMDSLIRVFTTFIAGVSAISLVVGGIGVMNIMLVSVTERTREIGIRKALGAKTSTILFQFLTESVIMCLIGGAIGFILGAAGAAMVSHWMNIPITMKLSTIAIAVGFSSAIGIFFGIYPARRAAKMLPIDALRRD